MAAFQKFHQFVGDLGTKKHDLNADTLKVYLSNATPDAAADAVKVDLAEISAGNGYPAGGPDINNSYGQVGGVGKLAGDDQVITASGGTIGPFRYAILYNDTPTSPADPLIGWWDYGTSITLNDGESFTINIADNTEAITIA